MPECYLRLQFRNDHDGSGKLFARAEADGFAGKGSAYFSIETVEKFASDIAAFPLPSNGRLSITSGFSDQEHLGISVYPAHVRRGYIGVQVRMATEVWPDTRPDSQKKAVVEVITTYEPLSKFSKDLVALMRGSVNEALLVGEIFREDFR